MNPTSDARIVPANKKMWTNWHKSFRVKIADQLDIYNPAGDATLEKYAQTTAALQQAIGQAQSEGRRIRAYGSGWSLSQAAVCDGYLVNSAYLNFTFNVAAGSLADDSPFDPGLLLFAQCGCAVSEINRVLEASGRSLHTSGSANGQTIVGASSANTHGSVLEFGAIHDHIVGLHIIVAADRHVWIEPKSAPVASDAFIARLGAEAIRDDDMFAAAVLSFGSFGIIHCVMLRVRPRFMLDAYLIKIDWNDALYQAMDSGDFTTLPLPRQGRQPHFFEPNFSPFDQANAYVSVMYDEPDDPTHVPDYRTSPDHRIGFAALDLIRVITDQVPQLIPTLVTAAMGDVFASNHETGTWGEIFDYFSPDDRAACAAIAVDAAETSRAMHVILDVLRQTPALTFLSARFVRKSQGLMTFTRYDRTCVLSLDSVLSNQTSLFYARMWEAMDAAGIDFTSHWGKSSDFSRARVARTYGPNLAKWLDLRRQLLGAAGLATFSNAITDQW